MDNLLPKYKTFNVEKQRDESNIMKWDLTASHPESYKLPYYLEGVIPQFVEKETVFGTVFDKVPPPNEKYLTEDSDISPLSMEERGEAVAPTINVPAHIKRMSKPKKSSAVEDADCHLLVSVLNALGTKLDMFFQMPFKIQNVSVGPNEHYFKYIAFRNRKEDNPYAQRDKNGLCMFLSMTKESLVTMTGRQVVQDYQFNSVDPIGMQIEMKGTKLICSSVNEDDPDASKKYQASKYAEALTMCEIVAVNGQRVCNLEEFQQCVWLAKEANVGLLFKVLAFKNVACREAAEKEETFLKSKSVNLLFSSLRSPTAAAGGGGSMFSPKGDGAAAAAGAGGGEIKNTIETDLAKPTMRTRKITKFSRVECFDSSDEEEDLSPSPSPKNRSRLYSTNILNEGTSVSITEAPLVEVPTATVRFTVATDDDSSDGEGEGLKAKPVRAAAVEAPAPEPETNPEPSPSLASQGEEKDWHLTGVKSADDDDDDDDEAMEEEEPYDHDPLHLAEAVPFNVLMCVPPMFANSDKGWGSPSRNVRFNNFTQQWNIQLFWVDEDGTLVLRKNLDAGMKYSDLVGSNHVWVLQATLTPIALNKELERQKEWMSQDEDSYPTIPDEARDNDLKRVIQMDQTTNASISLMFRASDLALSDAKSVSVVWVPWVSCTISQRMRTKGSSLFKIPAHQQTRVSQMPSAISSTVKTQLVGAGNGAMDEPEDEPHLMFQIFDKAKGLVHK